MDGEVNMESKQEMTNEREAQILERAVETWTDEEQEDILIEEMSELTKAIIKLRRGSINKESDDVLAELEDNVREEMADVQIMLNQMVLIHGDSTEWEIAKLERLEAKLQKS